MRAISSLGTLSQVGHQQLTAAHLSGPVYTACREALLRPGRLFSATPVWARLFLAWCEALDAPPQEALLRAAVACEFLATGFDLIDDVYDQAGGPALDWELMTALPASVALVQLAQETVVLLDLPVERRLRAGAALARASRQVFAAQAEDYALRHQPTAPEQRVHAILRRRSGTLGATPCRCAALLSGASWRLVALAGRFGAALGCAAQLEDDLADRVDDTRSGRKTLPTLLAQQYPDAPALVEATAWVLMQRFLQNAAQIIQRLPANVRTEPLWALLPPDAHAT